jgi:hypothetical protein
MLREDGVGLHDERQEKWMRRAVPRKLKNRQQNAAESWERISSRHTPADLLFGWSRLIWVPV